MSAAQALIDAICGRGWDAPVSPDPDAAAAALAADPGLPGRDLAVACAVGDVAAVQRFLDADFEAADTPCGPRHWKPLLYAAYSHAETLVPPGDPLGVLRALLDAGADPDAAYFSDASDNGFSALYGTIAVCKDRARMEALLQAGAAVSDGNSTYFAVESFDMALLRRLGEAGIDADDLGYTIKHAIDMGWGAAVELFLDLGADPDATHPAAEETTLHWAVKRGAALPLIERILAAGATVDARTTGATADGALLGETALDFALRLGRTDVAEWLRAAGATEPAAGPALQLVHAVARGDSAAAEALLAADPGLVDRLPEADRGLVPHWAQHGRSAAIPLAARLGFPLDGAAWMGLTAVHWGALRGDVELTRALLEAGAPVVDLGGYFGSPRHTATECRWYADGDYDAVLALLPE